MGIESLLEKNPDVEIYNPEDLRWEKLSDLLERYPNLKEDLKEEHYTVVDNFLIRKVLLGYKIDPDLRVE